MEDITKLPFAPWLEDVLKFLVEYQPEKIVVAGVNPDGSYFTHFFSCSAVDLFAMSGVIQSEGTWQEIKDRSRVLREIIDSEDEDDEDV